MKRNLTILAIALFITTLFISPPLWARGGFFDWLMGNSATQDSAPARETASSERASSVVDSAKTRELVNEYYRARKEALRSSRADKTAFERFNDIKGKYEAQFRRSSSTEETLDMLQNSNVLASDWARYADVFGGPSHYGDPKKLFNTIYAKATDQELTSLAIFLVYEQSLQQALITAYLEKFGQEGAKLLKETMIAMNPMMAVEAWLKKGKPKSEDDNSPGGAMGGKAPSQGGFGNTSRWNKGADPIAGNCLKAASLNLPSNLGGGGSSPLGDVPPDGGGAMPGTSHGPDGKPITGPGSDVQGMKGISAPCSAVDVNMLNDDKAALPPPSTHGKKPGWQFYHPVDSQIHVGKATDQHGLVYKVEVKVDYEQGYTVGIDNVTGKKILNKTDGDTRSTNFIKITDPETGATVATTSQSVYGDSKDNALKPVGQAEAKKEGDASKSTFSLNTKPKPEAKPKEPSKEGYVDPNAEVDYADTPEEKCKKAVLQTANDCYMKEISGIGSGTSHYTGLQCLKGLGSGGGGNKTGTTIGPDGGPMPFCGGNADISAMDFMKIFMETGGGVIDPMMQKGGAESFEKEGNTGNGGTPMY